MFDLSGKTAIVTGATKGIGREIAGALARAGSNIVVVSRNQRDCERVAAEIADSAGVSTLAAACDVSKRAAVDELTARACERFGKIDILVNNAGVAVTKPAEELTEEDWDYVLNVDLKGVFLLSQAVGRHMIAQKGGRIINIASMFGLVGSKSILPYLCSKGGVIQMTKGLALEWSRHRITVNAVAPGYVVTPINEAELSDEHIKGSLLKKIPLHRFAAADEVAGAVVYLASDEAGYVTGAVLSVDGGWTAQ